MEQGKPFLKISTSFLQGLQKSYPVTPMAVLRSYS